MDTVGFEVPQARNRIDRRLAAAVAAASAIAGLAGGYAVGTSSQSASPALVAHTSGATWGDALRESLVVKRHAREIARFGAVDVQLRRVEG